MPGNVVELVARQVGVAPGMLEPYEWSGSTFDYHRAQVRAHLGFRTATVGDQEELTEWLASNVACAERRPDRVREELPAQLRIERIEPPTALGCCGWFVPRCGLVDREGHQW